MGTRSYHKGFYMSSLLENFQQAVVQRAPKDAQWDDFKAKWPTIFEALFGAPDEEGKERMPPITIQLYAGDGKLKYVLSPKSGSKIAFGTCEGPDKGLDALEQAMASKHHEWKPRKGRI
jgi:hypothetical protein